MQRIAILFLPLLMVSCTASVDPVPDNGRVVVAPKGSSEREKPWNGITKEEANAKLGPISGMMNRR